MRRHLSLLRGLVRALTPALLSIAAGCASSSDDAAATITIAGTPSPDPVPVRATAVATIFAEAKGRELDALVARATATDAAHPGAAPSVDPAVALSLFALDRERYAAQFAANYPQTRDGLMRDYGTSFVAAHVEPKGALFPILSLASLATAGDPNALVHLLGAVAVTDENIGAAYRDQAGRALAIVPPAATLDALAALGPGRRLATISELNWCARSPAKLLAFMPTPEPLPSGATPTAGIRTPGPAAVRIASIQTAIEQSATLRCHSR